jgi:hypothetical protein
MKRTNSELSLLCFVVIARCFSALFRICTSGKLGIEWNTLVLFYADNVNTINKNLEALLEATREVGLEVNTEKPSVWLCLSTKIQHKIVMY